MNKILQKWAILRGLSFSEAASLIGRSLLKSSQLNGRPRDEFVFADTAGYVLQNGGTCRCLGKVNRLTLPEYEQIRNLMIEVRRGTTDCHIFGQVFRSREYEPCVELVRALNPAQVTVVDAGSNIGCSPVWWCSVFPGARVAAIELEAGNYRQLETNIGLNHLQSAVTPFHRALWTHAGAVSVNADFRDGREYAFTARNIPGSDAGADAVQGITMAELRTQLGWDEITLLKIDIEGGEAGLLEDEKTAAETLRAVRVVALEIHDEVADRTKIEANLQSLGYTLHRQHETLFGTRGPAAHPPADHAAVR